MEHYIFKISLIPGKYFNLKIFFTKFARDVISHAVSNINYTTKITLIFFPILKKREKA